jgi:hypothetical protein
MIRKELDWDIDFGERAETIVTHTSSPLYERVYYFQDKERKRMFIIICDKTQLSELIQLRSLDISFEESESRFRISCTDPDFNDTFEKIFLEIFEIMESGESIFEEVYNKIIKIYSTFLRKQLLLSQEEQIGLLGELIFLKKILLIDNKELFCWSDKTEDFIIKDIYIEVKSTRSKEHKHIINGLAQLTILPDTKKYLSSNLLTVNDKYKPEGSVNLYDLTISILSVIDVNSKDDFIERLRKRGYAHLINGNMYEECNFTFYEKKMIQISTDFPCLNLKSLDEKLFSNIDPNKIEYELNLENRKSNFTDLTSSFLKKIIF